jgi:hypothetical protein
MTTRLFLIAAASLALGGAAHADAPLTVGVLIPRSKPDKGWMESGYDGLERAEIRHQRSSQSHTGEVAIDHTSA